MRRVIAATSLERPPISEGMQCLFGRLGKPRLSELEPDLQGRHAWSAQNHGISADDCAESKTPDLILLVHHISDVSRHVELRSSNIVPLDPGVEQGVATDPGVRI